MLSTFPATFSLETMFSDQFPSFSTGFLPWDCSEFNTTIQSQNQATPPRSADSVADERKLKRKISNRESARRSRMRKQNHLENLRNHVNQLRYVNRVLTSRLNFTMSHCHRVMAENEQLRCEETALRQRLAEIMQVLMVRHMMQEQFTSTTGSSWPCNSATLASNPPSTTSEQIPSLITY